MIKVLIADDEKIECQGLEAMIRHYFPQVQVLGYAENGVELISAVKENHPDIILLDINMPGLNGLESLEILHAQNLDAKVIVCTAYSQFEYAQKALRLGVQDFLLKPIDVTELTNSIRSILDEIRRKNKENNQKERMESLDSQNHYSMGQLAISSVLLGEPDRESFRYWLLGEMVDEEPEFVEKSAGMILMSVKTSTLSDSKAVNELAYEKVKDALEQLGNYSRFIGKTVDAAMYFLIIPKVSLDERTYKDWCMSFAVKIEGISHIHDLQFYFSGWLSDFSESDRAVKECRYLMLHPLDHTGKVHFYREADKSGSMLPGIYDAVKDVANAVTEQQWEIAENRIHIYISMLRETDLSGMEMHIVMVCLIKSIFKELQSIYPDIADTYDTFLIPMLFDNEKATLEQIAETSMEQIKKLFESGEDDNRVKKVYDAIRFIYEHYDENISLDHVADSLNISSFYLSRLFRQHVGYGFVEILTYRRIEMAVSLIRSDPSMSIKTISEQIGFTSESYFYKVFKKQTGITVGRLREILV